MKYLYVIFALVCSNVFADNYVRVVGRGSTFEEAKTNAFKTAVEFRVGMVLLSDRETKNHELTKREIAIYSSGYVDNYKLLNQRVHNNQFEVVMDVFVSDSKISRRLLSNGIAIQQFENSRHSEQINSIIVEKQNGDKLLKQVMNDYPFKAYNIKQLPYQLKFDSQRNLQLFVPYEIKWNENFVNAYRELVYNLQEGIGQLGHAPGNVYFMTNQGYVESAQQFKFFDLIRISAMRQHFINENEVRLELKIKDNTGKLIGRKCYYPNFVVGKNKPLYSLGRPNTVVIWQNEVENNHVQFNFNYNGDLSRLMFFIHEIELSISRDKECGNN